MPATTPMSSTAVVPFRRIFEGSGIAASSPADPHDREAVKQRDQRQQHNQKRPIACPDRALALARHLDRRHNRPLPVWSTSTKQNTRNRYTSEKPNICRALLSVGSRQTRIAAPIKMRLSTEAHPA